MLVYLKSNLNTENTNIYLFCTASFNLQLTAVWVWADVDAVESQSELANILLEWAPHVTSKECYLLT